MQAIVTKYLPATNTRGSRIKATCARGSMAVPYDDGLNLEDNHTTAARELCNRFIREDAEKYNSLSASNPWGKPFVTGGLPSGNHVHVFIS